jgi:hypothetical protein
MEFDLKKYYSAKNPYTNWCSTKIPNDATIKINGAITNLPGFTKLPKYR